MWGNISVRVVEAYLGEYASGKSENAINRALQLVGSGRKVTLVDFDIVKPFYTLRPIKKNLESKGVDVLSWETSQTIGLGETGNVLLPGSRWALRRTGDIILDVGYGVEGARTLNLLEGAKEDKDLKICVVVSITRPLTSTVEDIVDYVRDMDTNVDIIINNSHLGDETTVEVVQDGAGIVTEAAKRLGVGCVITTALKEIALKIGGVDCMGNELRALHRYMPQSFW
ncbi:MAG TPA: hypothetical protein VFD15_01625 [Clostridia bacterium]|nr:hypothetical protein [Clostridia bacterium]